MFRYAIEFNIRTLIYCHSNRSSSRWHSLIAYEKLNKRIFSVKCDILHHQCQRWCDFIFSQSPSPSHTCDDDSNEGKQRSTVRLKSTAVLDRTNRWQVGCNCLAVGGKLIRWTDTRSRLTHKTRTHTHRADQQSGNGSTEIYIPSSSRIGRKISSFYFL